MRVQDIILKIENKLAWIYINKESSLNALREQTFNDINLALDFIEKDKEVRVVLIRGVGDKAFVAGADITQFPSFSGEDARKNSHLGQQTFLRIEKFMKPVIAVINGYALGGGLELALSCHIRIASENAKLGLPEVNLGITPGYGGIIRLTSLVGKSRALELILTGKHITAQEAFSMGIINKVVPHENLDKEAESFALSLAEKNPVAIASIIATVSEILPDDNCYAIETENFVKAFITEEAKNKINEFLTKRKR